MEHQTSTETALQLLMTTISDAERAAHNPFALNWTINGAPLNIVLAIVYLSLALDGIHDIQTTPEGTRKELTYTTVAKHFGADALAVCKRILEGKPSP